MDVHDATVRVDWRRRLLRTLARSGRTGRTTTRGHGGGGGGGVKRVSYTRGVSVAKWKVNGKCQMEIRLVRRARTGVKRSRGDGTP